MISDTFPSPSLLYGGWSFSNFYEGTPSDLFFIRWCLNSTFDFSLLPPLSFVVETPPISALYSPFLFLPSGLAVFFCRPPTPWVIFKSYLFFSSAQEYIVPRPLISAPVSLSNVGFFSPWFSSLFLYGGPSLPYSPFLRFSPGVFLSIYFSCSVLFWRYSSFLLFLHIIVFSFFVLLPYFVFTIFRSELP